MRPAALVAAAAIPTLNRMQISGKPPADAEDFLQPSSHHLASRPEPDADQPLVDEHALGGNVNRRRAVRVLLERKSPEESDYGVIAARCLWSSVR